MQGSAGHGERRQQAAAVLVELGDAAADEVVEAERRVLDGLGLSDRLRVGADRGHDPGAAQRVEHDLADVEGVALGLAGVGRRQGLALWDLVAEQLEGEGASVTQRQGPQRELSDLAVDELVGIVEGLDGDRGDQRGVVGVVGGALGRVRGAEVGDNQQQRRRLRGAHQRADQPSAVDVGPLEVVDVQEQGAALADPGQDLA